MRSKSSEIPQDSDLLKHILLFSQTLRTKKVGVTTENVVDALRGISFIDIQSKDDFYQLLKSNFISKKEESVLFDELFEHFWSFENGSLPSVKQELKEETGDSRGKGQKDFLDLSSGDPSLLESSNSEERMEGDPGRREVLRYSPEEILSRKEFSHLETGELEKVREFVLTLTRRLALNLSRRWKKGKGDQIDLRRSIRQSIKYGGEMMELRRKRPKQKPFRIVLICDVSGSMDVYIQFFLLFMYSLQRHYPPCETFVFSTGLNHTTPLLKRRDLKEALPLLSAKVRNWSGGTNIGVSLHQFHRRYEHLLSPDRTLLLVFSDGWDRGDTSLLDSEMSYLKKQVKKIIWLNPLAGSQSYQPLCKGMVTALPYIDHFLPCHNFLSLRSLSYLIMKRP